MQRHFSTFSAYMLCKKFGMVEIETLWLSRIKLWGTHCMSVLQCFL